MAASSPRRPTTRSSPSVSPGGNDSFARMPIAPAEVIRKCVTRPPSATASHCAALASAPIGRTEPTRRGADPWTDGDLIPSSADSPFTFACANLLLCAAISSCFALGARSMLVTGAVLERNVTASAGTPLNFTRLGISVTEGAATTVPAEKIPATHNTAKFRKIIRIRILASSFTTKTPLPQN